jgi:hypothetical protein
MHPGTRRAIAIRTVSVALILTNIVGLADSEPASKAAAATLSSTGQMGSTTESGHVYSSEELSTLISPPISISDLLENLKVAWDKRLLVQPEFWPKAALLRFFNAGKLTWGMDVWGRSMAQQARHWSQERGLADHDGRMNVYSRLLNDPIFIQRSHLVTKEESASWVYHYPSHTEAVGHIIVGLDANSNITWGQVRRLFGSGAINKGPPPAPISYVSPQVPDTGAHMYRVATSPLDNGYGETALTMCYQTPDPLPSKMAEWEYDQACFNLKRVAAPPTTPPYWEPRDDDIVVLVRMSEHQGHIPMFCYAIKLDATLTPRCPPRLLPKRP